MSDPTEGNSADLFDFEIIPDLEEFGLGPQGAAASADAATPQEATDSPVAADENTESDASAADGGEAAALAARANPPVPEGVTDLDEDLFGFDELFSLEDDPYYNGTLDGDGQPTEPIPSQADVAAEAAVADEASTAAEPASDGATVEEADPLSLYKQDDEPTADEAGPAPENIATAASSPKKSKATAAAQTAGADDLFDAAGLHLAGDASAAGHAPSLRDRGPRILLPEDVPYSERADRQRIIWALVACFLAVNTGIFFLAQRANSSFQASLSDATRVLADALVQRTSTPTHAAEPAELGPDATHSIDAPDLTDPGGDQVPPVKTEPEIEPDTAPLPETQDEPRTEPWVDPRNYENTHDIAVGTAKAMLTEGRFEDSRKLLNHVLANQDRIPLSPQLREEIDYLIPLTYFEQGRATRAEDSQ